MAQRLLAAFLAAALIVAPGLAQAGHGHGGHGGHGGRGGHGGHGHHGGHAGHKGGGHPAWFLLR